MIQSSIMWCFSACHRCTSKSGWNTTCTAPTSGTPQRSNGGARRCRGGWRRPSRTTSLSPRGRVVRVRPPAGGARPHGSTRSVPRPSPTLTAHSDSLLRSPPCTWRRAPTPRTGSPGRCSAQRLRSSRHGGTDRRRPRRSRGLTRTGRGRQR